MSEPLDLSGVTVLVTRPEAQARPLAERIRGAGGVALIAPSLGIEPLPDPPVLPDGPLDGVIFISRNAVLHGLPRVRDLLQNPQTLVFAVGLGTRTELAAQGLDEVLAPKLEFSSEGLLSLPALSREQVRGKRLLIVRGSGGRETLRETLVKRGAEVSYLESYRRVIPDTDLARAIGEDTPDIAVVSSADGLANLAEMIDRQGLERLFDVPLMVPGERVAEQVDKLGFTQDPVIADNPSDAGFLKALGAWVSGDL